MMQNIYIKLCFIMVLFVLMVAVFSSFAMAQKENTHTYYTMDDANITGATVVNFLGDPTFDGTMTNSPASITLRQWSWTMGWFG